MAIHQDSWSLACEAVDEYLFTIDWCLKHRKQDGGCLGYPATLLMLSLINAFGVFLRNEKVSIAGKLYSVTRGEPFRVLNHALFNQNLTDREIKIIEKAYRNLLSHNAMLAPNCWLLPGTAARPFTFEGIDAIIDIYKLHNLVRHAWDVFDKKRIKEAVARGYIHIPTLHPR